jgi:hypothetical protein
MMRKTLWLFALAALTLPGCGPSGGGPSAPPPPPPSAGGGGQEGTQVGGGTTQTGAAGTVIAPTGVTVSGAIKFDGTPPERNNLAGPMSGIQFCADSHTGPVLSEEVVVGPEGGLMNAFVYVSAGPALSGTFRPDMTKKAKLDQTGCLYVPHVPGMMAGQDLDIVNSDRTMHNVNCQPQVNASFNQAQPVPGTFTKSLRRPEMAIRFNCNVHPWMGAYLHVMDHPFFAVTDEQGRYTIPNLPPGEHTLTVWTEALGTKEITVEVGESPVTNADASFSPGVTH